MPEIVPLDVVRLAKVLGRLGSEHAAEVTEAGRLAHRMLTAAGRQWGDLLGSASSFGPARRGDPPLRGPGGIEVYPPVGEHWIDSLMLLCTCHAGADHVQRAFLDRCLRDLRAGGHPQTVLGWQGGMAVRTIYEIWSGARS